MSKKQITEQQIMQAALAVAAEKGAGKVTLDAVAKASGLSKGGLLYHYPSKEALITAMVHHLLAEAEQSRQQIAQQEPALLVTLLKARQHFTQQISGNTAMAILAAAAEQPALLSPVKQHNQKVLAEVIAKHGESAEAMLLMLASEGLTLQDLLTISPFNAAQRALLEAYMLKRAKELSV